LYLATVWIYSLLHAVIIIIIINRFVYRREVVTSEALGPSSVLVSRETRESQREEECLKPKLKNCNRVTIENSAM